MRERGGTRKSRMPQIFSHSCWWMSLLAGVFLRVSMGAYEQKPAGAGSGNTSLPDSPQPKQQALGESGRGNTQKFIGYVSNKSFVFPDIAASEGPLPVSGKFKIFVNQSISPPYIFAATFMAGISQTRNVPEAYGQGWDAYGGRFGAAIARASSTSFFSTIVFES